MYKNDRKWPIQNYYLAWFRFWTVKMNNQKKTFRNQNCHHLILILSDAACLSQRIFEVKILNSQSLISGSCIWYLGAFELEKVT